MTTKEEVQQLISEGWIVTDPSCNQMMKEVIKNREYLFREDRLINPVTGETRLYEESMDWDDYAYEEDKIIDACESFGYSTDEVQDWIYTEREIPLMLECLFEQSYDQWVD